MVNFLRKYVRRALVIPGLGELQKESDDRKQSWKKGYQKGQPDLIINNPMGDYIALCIEFKTPTGKGKLSKEQISQLNKYAAQGFKCIVSNDYDRIIIDLVNYFGIRS